MNENKVKHHWQAPEFEVYEKSARWYVIAGLLDGAMIVYGLLTNSPIMSITFILIGIVGYIYIQKEPRVLDFKITEKGVVAGKELYPFENISSFWIFYEPFHKVISLHTHARMVPFVHIPLADEDPAMLREILLNYIPEIKQEPSIVDTIERAFHI